MKKIEPRKIEPNNYVLSEKDIEKIKEEYELVKTKAKEYHKIASISFPYECGKATALNDIIRIFDPGFEKFNLDVILNEN